MAHANYLHSYGAPPSLADLEAMAREAMNAIPQALRRFVSDVVVRVEDFPDEDTMEEMDLETEFDLLGLYRGVDLRRRSILEQPEALDMIYLYRRPILDYWCETGDDLMRVVRHVLVHEIGHHFGLSDEDMDRIEMGA
jgi:predicted Zn-dependent protease with MMP-like domain